MDGENLTGDETLPDIKEGENVIQLPPNLEQDLNALRTELNGNIDPTSEVFYTDEGGIQHVLQPVSIPESGLTREQLAQQYSLSTDLKDRMDRLMRIPESKFATQENGQHQRQSSPTMVSQGQPTQPSSAELLPFPISDRDWLKAIYRQNQEMIMALTKVVLLLEKNTPNSNRMIPVGKYSLENGEPFPQ